MKLTSLTLRDDARIPELGFRFASDANYDLSFDAGLVTIVRKDKPEEDPFLVPLASVKYMRPAKVAKKA